MMDGAKLVRRILTLLVLLIVALVIKNIVLGGVSQTSLQKAPALAAAIAPSLADPGSKELPVIGKDFRISSAQYFDNNSWVVVLAQHLPDNNRAALVLEKIGGVYTVVLGPGTSFSSSVTFSMPIAVSSYMQSKGLIN